ncbi:hypothetical protein LNTAR_15347 [Lentisphaera araneosa HTCC2155]|uniref:Uncharacterized protein n=1 Tax=Lentisphaera araneosa HTCC2155 TaxID=313628 RepID=A6DU54_9BACT|nr:hypothetical protein [Lentisphaera araneosa]EDM24813.1 hypothetical protein LNTAR_15347 [Lentisphaera araneosa HTCC2155]
MSQILDRKYDSVWTLYNKKNKTDYSMKNNKTIFFTLIGIYAAALLAWPFLSFGAIFAFDAPGSDTPLNFYFVFSIWLYPLFVILGYTWGHHKRNSSTLAVVLKTSIPLLSGIWLMIIPIGAHMITDALITTEDETLQIAIKEKLDPIYQKRLESIKQRDPIQDAKEAIKRNEIAFLPSGLTPYVGYYRGLDGDKNEQDKVDPEKNYSRIENSPYLKEIHDLVFDDSHTRDPKGHYISNVHNQYYVATWTYKIAFNTEILSYLKQAKIESEFK